MHDFKSLGEVLTYNHEVLVIDLLDHVMALDEEPFLNALVEPTKGIYLIGSIEPLLDQSKVYYPRAMYPNPKSKITDFSKILSIQDDIVNSSGETVLTRKDMVTKAKFIKKEPTVPVSALKVAISIVEQYLTTACRHSKRSHPRYRLEYLVKPEYQELVVSDEYMHAFNKLLDQVMLFVGDDQWNIYFTKTKGTSLIVEKSVDYRIYCYYENYFKSQDQQED